MNHIGEISQSNNCGPMQIINYYGCTDNSNKHTIVRVKFLYTGYCADIRYDHFLSGIAKDPEYCKVLNTVYVSLPYGPIKVLRFIGIDNNETIVEIQFMNSLNIISATLNNVRDGTVVDPAYIPINDNINWNYTGKVDIDRIYTSNLSGNFKILSIFKENGTNKCAIKFLLTGYEKIVALSYALNGCVKDDYQESRILFDRSLILDYDKWVCNRLKATWRMLKDRCTNSKNLNYDVYGGAGVTLAPEWYDYNNFENDCKTLFQFDKYYNNPMDYQIDKDYLQMHLPKNERIYSKSTCVFLHYFDNDNLRSIDNFNQNCSKFSSKYYGVVSNTPGSYTAIMRVNGVYIMLGTFNNEIAAASAYNYWHKKYHRYELVPLLNNINEMPPEEFVKYNTNVKKMYDLI